jgi:hypothetical protein
MLAACAAVLIRSRARDRDREAKHDHDPEQRRARLLAEAREALCLAMLAACTVAAIRSQLVAVPPTVPVCGLCALVAAFGSKGPPPRSPKRA